MWNFLEETFFGISSANNSRMSPTLVSKYETELIDKKLLERKLDEFFLLADNVEEKEE